MSFQNLLYQPAGHVVWITINRPDARNALSQAVIDELRAALSQARADGNIRVVVLTGAGDKAFCAGGDLASFFQTQSPLEGHHNRGSLRDLFLELADLGKPTIAAVNGHCLAGGFGLALGCDLLVAAEHATFGAPEVDAGLFPMIIMPTIFRNLGRKKGLELIMLGDRIPAADGERLGFVNRVVPGDQLRSAAGEMAARLAAKSPAVLRLGREAFYTMSDMTFSQAVRYCHAMLSVNLLAEDAQEGPRAFKEKRPPQWKGK